MKKKKQEKKLVQKRQTKPVRKYKDYVVEFIHDFECRSVREFAEKHGLSVSYLEDIARLNHWVQRRDAKRQEIMEKAEKELSKRAVRERVKELTRQETTIKAVSTLMKKIYNDMMDGIVPVSEAGFFKAIEAWRKEEGEADTIMDIRLLPIEALEKIEDDGTETGTTEAETDTETERTD